MIKLQGKIPQIRFPEFKDAWQQKAIGDVFELNARPIPKPLENYKSIGIRSHFKGTFQRLDSDPSKNVMDTLFEVKENDLIVNITFAWEGAVAIASKDDEGGLVSHRFPTYINDKNKVEIDFFRFLFPTSEFKRTLTLISPGSAGRNRVLKKSDFLKIKFLFPTLPEQTRIASFFSVLDKKIAQLKQKKSFLEQYKKGVMQKIFSQELRFKDDYGKEFPKWEKKKLGEIFKIKTEKYNPTKESYSVKCVELEHLATGTGKLLGYVEGSDLNSIKNKFKNGDVLFGKLRPYLRKFLKPNFDGVCSSEIWVLQGLKVSNHFLYWLIQTDYFIEIANKSSGSKMPRADWSLISAQGFRFPVEKEQNKIANFLSAIDEKINRTENQLKQTQEYKKGLLQKMFC